MSLPRRFGRYLLLDKLATGGMAEIYEARLIGVEGFEKPLAIKMILAPWSDKPAFIAMLIDEAKIAVRLNHPNVVQAYELGKEGSQYYIAMELVEGVDLRELQRVCQIMDRRLPTQLVVWIAHEMAQALVYAHGLCDAQGRSLELIHRDISPQNILVSYDGQIKITDFGIAKAADSQHETMTGVFKGKFAYMSPEQAEQRDMDQRSDLFSLGIIIYELATGKRLFAARTEVEVLDSVRAAAVPHDDPDFNSLRPALKELILELLSKDREKRPADAGLVAERLKSIMQTMEVVPERSALAAFLNEILVTRRQKRLSARGARANELKQFFNNDETVSVTVEDKAEPSMPLPEGTQVLVTAWKQVESSLGLRRVWRPLWVGSLAVAAVALIAVIWSLNTSPARAPLAMSPAMPKPAALPTPPVVPDAMAVVKATPFNDASAVDSAVSVVPAATPVALEKPVEVVKGRLSVQAIPWGYVYVDQSSKRYETPVTGLKLAAGKHLVKVVYSPTGEVVQRTVDIQGGKGVTCIARFGAHKGVVCR